MESASHPAQSQTNYEGAKIFMEKIQLQIFQDFNGKHLTDVTFKLSNPSALIPAHRLILSAGSPYFRELFNSHDALIEIAEIDSVTFKKLMIFCYTATMSVAMDDVDTLLKAAVTLQFEDAVRHCANFIIENIPIYPLQRVYALTSEQKSVALDQKIFEYEIKNFMNIIQTAEFLKFDHSKLQKIVENDDLNVESERDVYEAVKRWYEYDALARESHLHELISCLRLTQFKRDFITTNIHTLPGCQSLALEALTAIDGPSDHSNVKLKYTKPREGEEKILFAFNREPTETKRFWQEEGLRAIFKYDYKNNFWEKWGDLKIDFDHFEVIFKDDSLFITGYRRHAQERTYEFCRWNLETKTFKTLPSMNEPRNSHTLAILNEKIYAIGGYKGEFESKEVTPTVEVYSTFDGWKFVKSMNVPRYGATTAVYNGKLYVFGGADPNELNSVECYDPLTDSWTQCADMIEKYITAGATVHNGYIFVLCGNFSESLPTIDRYDPQKNEWTKFWTFKVDDDDEDIRETYCFSFQSRLWAYLGIGAGFENEEFENRISVYDEENNKFQKIARLPIIPGMYYCFTVSNILFRRERQNVIQRVYPPIEFKRFHVNVPFNCPFHDKK